MKSLSRFAGLGLVPLFALTLMVAGCASGTNYNQAVLTATQDVVTIDAGLKGALTNLQTLKLPGLTAQKLENVQTALNQLNAAAVALQTTAATTAAQPQVKQVEASLNTIVATLAGLPLPPTIQMPLAAASVLLPVAESTVGLIVGQVTASNAATGKTTIAAATPATSALPGGIDGEARAILLTAATR